MPEKVATLTQPKLHFMNPSLIRNFCIIAHIDHGKSTLADRLIETTDTLDKRDLREQVLDNMDLERERGITIKASAVTLYHDFQGQIYELNLIDTPGHVDFHYEVSRSLAACDGAVLLVDAAQGVEAQTVANAYAAIEHDLMIIPVLNKIDIAQARPEEVTAELEQILGFHPDEVRQISARSGIGIRELLSHLIRSFPPPSGDMTAPLRALIFDCKFDEFRGVIMFIRVVDGDLQSGQTIQLLKSQTAYEVTEIGRLRPEMTACKKLTAGQVGYCIANLKSLDDVHIGDTVSNPERPPKLALPGYQQPKPMVFCGLYPVESQDFEKLRSALMKLRLNDASFIYEPETSEGLGFGFRCGFLGMLHMDIVQERLERESNIELIQTAPNVTYQIVFSDNSIQTISNPQDVPADSKIEAFHEPVVRVSFLLPTDAMGSMMQLCEDRRGVYQKTEYLSPVRAMLTYDLPLAEVIYDLYDKLKSATRGYGTMDYELLGYRPADLVRLDLLVADHRVDALSTIVHRKQADRRARRLVQRLKNEIDRHLFEVIIQAAIGNRIIARERIAPLRKNVTAKCYGGDITRKRKLWAKQRAGKKRLKQVGQVEIPQRAFLAVLDNQS